VRRVLQSGRVGTTRTRSEFEEAFLGFIEPTGLPVPLFNQELRIRGREIEPDCLWPEQRVILELDGRETHHTAAAFESDRARDRALTAAGWRPIRITWRQLRSERRRLEAELRAILGS
jgi:very-short-patch-repair endonuclease